MKHLMKREEGQSIIIVAFALIALVALLALVVDAGNAYVQERQFQNAVDAGSQAGAIALAQNKNNGQVASAINSYLGSNGVDSSKTKAYYVVQDNLGNHIVVRTSTVDAYGQNSPAPTTLTVNGAALPVIGVQIEGNKSFPTFFAGIVGWRQMQVGGNAASFALCGASGASDLFPMAVSSGTFINGNIILQQDNPTYSYRIYENKLTAPSNLVYLTWNNDQSDGTLVNNMANVKNSGPWSSGDSPLGVSDSMYASSSVYNQMQQLKTSSTQVTIPVYDTVSGGKYHIAGFARALIINVYKGRNGRNNDYGYLDIRFQLWVAPSGTGGGTDYGVCAVKTSDTQPQRVLQGTVSFQEITLNSTPVVTNTHVPVDVVNILDTSGSMNDSFGSQSKIQAAQQGLTSFNNNMLPLQGDQVGLVTFPTMTDGDDYNYTCTNNGWYNIYYFAQQVDGLTNNIAHVNSDINNLSANGGTPLAAGLKQGLATLLAGHKAGNVGVIIVASDGLANITLNGQWTGFQGNTFSAPTCNDGAVQDAIDQANLAKAADSSGNPKAIVYSIAVGNDFNPDVLRAIASTDTNLSKPHYFRATDATSMASIYQQISQQVQTIGADSCNTTKTTSVAAGSLILKDPSGTQTTVPISSIGEFIVPNAQVGTYTFVSATITKGNFTYNVFTKYVGGPDLTTSPTLNVGVAQTTWSTDLSLRNSTPIVCPH